MSFTTVKIHTITEDGFVKTETFERQSEGFVKTENSLKEMNKNNFDDVVFKDLCVASMINVKIRTKNASIH